MNQHLERIETLAPFLRTPALTLIARCEEVLHRTLLVVYGWRSMAEQAVIYQYGRTLDRETGVWDITDPSKVVTRALLSGHNIVTTTGEPASMCLDVVPFLVNGTIDWTPGELFWESLYELSWKVGLDPYGDMIGAYLMGDAGHFEEPNWKMKLDGLGLMFPVVQEA